jgi:hypothetical protein
LIDGNGNLVPDGTEVTFEATYETGNQYLPAISGLTKAGLAEASFNLHQPGTVVFSARSGDLARGDGPRLLIAPPPTLTPPPSATPTSTPASTPAPIATHSPTPSPVAATATPTALAAAIPPAGASPAGDNGGAVPPLAPKAGRLLLALLGIAIAGFLGYLVLGLRTARPARQIRWSLLCISGGMLGYILYLLVLPGAWQVPAAACVLALLGALLALPLARGGAVARQA